MIQLCNRTYSQTSLAQDAVCAKETGVHIHLVLFTINEMHNEFYVLHFRKYSALKTAILLKLAKHMYTKIDLESNVLT